MVKIVQTAVQRYRRNSEENRTDIGKRRELFEKPPAGVGKRSETNIEYVHGKTPREFWQSIFTFYQRHGGFYIFIFLQ